MKTNEIKVCIADDHQEIAYGLNALLKNESQINVVGMLKSKEELKQWFSDKSNDADVLLLDINMPTAQDGMDSCEFIRREYPYTKIITYSGHMTPYWVQQFVDLGVAGFVEKGSEPKIVKQAIRTVKNGKKHYNDRILRMIEEYRQASAAKESLTDREVEVLRLILRGRKNGQIAEELSISENTVKTHRKSIKSKTRAEGLVDLFSFAKEAGLVDL